MAKCKYFPTKPGQGCLVRSVHSIKCPKNADYLCNIKNPKSNLVKIKAWASQYYEGDKLQTDVIVGSQPHDSFYPCTVTIDAKYLEGKK